MPELPEVETVRRGVDAAIRGGRISAVEVHHPRSVRRHLPGADDFAATLTGLTVNGSGRRGKFMWLHLDDGRALVCHLGMSGQFLVKDAGAEAHRHLRARLRFADEQELWFVDQRTFGCLEVADLDGAVPKTLGHIAPDVFEPEFDPARCAARLRSRRIEVKKALLDQTWISGVGNIYADEALWRAGIRGRRPGARVSEREAAELLRCVEAVLAEAIEAGGTSFDELYVRVNGESGHFSRDLAVYGKAGRPCRRCGTAIRREVIGDRSAHFCPDCQR
ncbi:bifunctional DNA-formamidopyrimidine glycosylase/DNA-(apurinic or apyrimidinic site) lyase [Glycomyces xiaoerkulensis]|uniref:bifunctional DNA-formamidopyrimidine glycosylase/DNA-(apurinic or apyrimidinic site) lyase n=1 Tax=Glycomyces xiaoerkulensis TaxID=2038139 RepID=UPI000C262294|nr:bifunctional DNA-formamidopyrimidine glycosylase/DNA-(apurinic or apyrimidinic site) lyase [Glycomyces xiaoerkulensis]